MTVLDLWKEKVPGATLENAVYAAHARIHHYGPK